MRTRSTILQPDQIEQLVEQARVTQTDSDLIQVALLEMKVSKNALEDDDFAEFI